jgi:hypothetical protein
VFRERTLGDIVQLSYIGTVYFYHRRSREIYQEAVITGNITLRGTGNVMMSHAIPFAATTTTMTHNNATEIPTWAPKPQFSKANIKTYQG